MNERKDGSEESRCCDKLDRCKQSNTQWKSRPYFIVGENTELELES